MDSWGVDFGLLDGAGELIQNPVHYRDERLDGAVQSVHSRMPARELYERTGIQLMPINTVYELAALADERDPALDRAETLLLIPDLFHHWLCGSRTSEYTNATTTQCFDAQTGGWAIDLLERLEIPARLFPEIVTPGTPSVRSRPRCRATGIDRATAVAAGTHDTASAVAAVPLRGPGSVYLSIGTWSLVGVETDEPLIDDKTFAANLTNEGGVAGTVRLLRNVTGLWLLHECRRTWGLEGREHAFEELIALQGRRHRCAPSSTRTTADLLRPATFRRALTTSARGRASSRRRPRRRRALRPREHRAEARAGRPHIGSGYRTGASGAAHRRRRRTNELLCGWTAEAAGLPVLAGPEEATLFGNLVVQAIALGEISSLAEAREVVTRSVTPTTYEPDDSAEWREARDRFAQIGEARSERR